MMWGSGYNGTLTAITVGNVQSKRLRNEHLDQLRIAPITWQNLSINIEFYKRLLIIVSDFTNLKVLYFINHSFNSVS